MTSLNSTDKISYEQFRDEWPAEIEEADLSQLHRGRRFATEL